METTLLYYNVYYLSSTRACDFCTTVLYSLFPKAHLVWWPAGDKVICHPTTALSTNKIYNQIFNLLCKDFPKIPTLKKKKHINVGDLESC